MATYFVNPNSGSDANTGTTAELAWKTADYATAMLSDGDGLVVVAPATAPVRNGLAPIANTVVYGESPSNRAYITGLINVSHGTTVENLLKNGDCEAWLSASEAWAVQLTGNPLAKSVDAHGGTYSIDATRVDANQYIGFPVYLPAGVNMSFTYWHKDTPTHRWKYRVVETTGPKYLQADGSWDAAGYFFDPDDSSASWHSHTKTFTTDAEGLYSVILVQTYTTTLLLDDVWLGYDGMETYQWSDVVDHDYKVLNVPFALAPSFLAKCTTTEWTANGMDALSMVSEAASLAECDSTPDSWYYDAGTDATYYHPAAGETVTNLHLEVCQLRSNTNGSTASGLVAIDEDNIIISNLAARYANDFGVLAAAGASGLEANYVESAYASNTCFYVVNGSSLIARHCIGRYSFTEEAFQVIEAGSRLVAESCIAEYAWDDGFQAGRFGTLICIRCISRLNGLEGNIDNTGFISEQESPVVELYNCTAYGNGGQGIACHGTDAGSMTVRNCIAYGTVRGASYDAYAAPGHQSFTHDHNLFGGHGGAWVVDGTEIEGSDPLFIDTPADLSLQSDSPAIGAGVDVGLFYSGDAPDCGAFERWASRGATWLHLAGVHEED